MRHIRPISVFVGSLVLAAVVGAAFGAGALQAAGPGDDGNQARDAKLTNKKYFDQAKAYMQKMQTAVRRDERKRDVAVQQKDLIKLNCLNEKLAQGQGHLKEAEQSLGALTDAITRRDGADRDHEFSRIRIYYQKILVLSAEADNCTGEESSYIGPSRIEVEVDSTIPQGDPTDPGLPAPNFTMPPPGVEEAAPDSPAANQNNQAHGQ